MSYAMPQLPGMVSSRLISVHSYVWESSHVQSVITTNFSPLAGASVAAEAYHQPLVIACLPMHPSLVPVSSMKFSSAPFLGPQLVDPWALTRHALVRYTTSSPLQSAH